VLKTIKTDFIRTDNCISTEKFIQDDCFGYCSPSSDSIYSIVNGVLQTSSSSPCCLPLKTYNSTITMQCLIDHERDIWEKHELIYSRIESCSCKQITY
jgi:hypothetical protein